MLPGRPHLGGRAHFTRLWILGSIFADVCLLSKQKKNKKGSTISSTGKKRGNLMLNTHNIIKGPNGKRVHCFQFNCQVFPDTRGKGIML